MGSPSVSARCSSNVKTPSSSLNLSSFFPLNPGNSSRMILLLDLFFFLLEDKDHGLGIECPNWILFWVKVFPPVGASEEFVSFLVLMVLYPQTLKMVATRIRVPDADPMIIQWKVLNPRVVLGEVVNNSVFVMLPLNSFSRILTFISPDFDFFIFHILIGSTLTVTTLLDVSFKAPHLMRLLSMLQEIGSSMCATLVNFHLLVTMPFDVMQVSVS